jgi:SAM-dependent methyltransferase
MRGPTIRIGSAGAPSVREAEEAATASTTRAEMPLAQTEENLARLERLERLKPLLACPACRGDLSFEKSSAHCSFCLKTYPIRGGRIYFIAPLTTDDALDSMKSKLKRLLGEWYYSIGVRVIAPSFPYNYVAALERHFDLDEDVVIDIGAGAHRADRRLVTLDAVDYDSVDIVADVAQLPFKSGRVDGFASNVLLEHVPSPETVAGELARCTKPGGVNLHVISFLYPYHASPQDFRRYSPSGALSLFPSDWTLLEQYNPTGPVSLLLVCLIDFLATCLSLPWPRLKGAVHLALCGILFPLKLLDLPFVRNRRFIGMAPTITTVVRRQ